MNRRSSHNCRYVRPNLITCIFLRGYVRKHHESEAIQDPPDVKGHPDFTRLHPFLGAEAQVHNVSSIDAEACPKKTPRAVVTPQRTPEHTGGWLGRNWSHARQTTRRGAGSREDGRRLQMAAARRWVPIATHYADPDDVDAAMRRLCDLEASDRTDGAPGDEVGCMRSGDGRRRVARVPHAFQARFTHFPAHPRAMRRQALVRVDRPQHDGRELTVCLVQRAQYLRVRPQLVDTVAQIAGLLGLSNDVVHLALAYLDRLHARTPRAGARLLAALACMVVAAKFSEVSQDDEGQGTLPSYHHVLAALGNPVGITTRHLVAWERRVLEVLEWRLSSATTSCFAHAYRAKGVFCADDTAGPERDGPPTPDEQARVCDHITFFCELATLQGITCAHGASVSAAAAVCAARVINDIHPSWPPSLARRLGKTYAHIDACTRTFLHLFRTQYADRAMDSDALLPAHAAALPSAPAREGKVQATQRPHPRRRLRPLSLGPTP